MSEEEFNFGDLDLQLDESTQARIAHAEFLESIKDWGATMGLICVPFTHMAQAVISAEENDASEDEKHKLYKRVATAMPTGVAILVEHLNELYTLLQVEAVKILGEPFTFHDDHHPGCDGTRENCGHQDHYKSDTNE